MCLGLCLHRWCVCAAGAVRLCVCLQGERQQGPAASARSSCADAARHPACGAAGWGQAIYHLRRWRVCFSNFNIVFVWQRWRPQTWAWRCRQRMGTHLWLWQQRPTWWTMSGFCCSTERHRTTPTAGTSLLCWSVARTQTQHNAHTVSHLHSFISSVLIPSFEGLIAWVE